MRKTEQQRKEWETRIAAFRASGLSARAWCKTQPVTQRQLGYWLRQFSDPTDPTPSLSPPSSRWIALSDDAVSAPHREHTPLTIRVGQAAVEVAPGVDPDLLAEVLHTLLAVC